MSTSRIDELRSKFEENPRRYFAPLANEYRKSGDLGTAIALCREYLPKQPGHMSGHIVFGQALFEAGELEESRHVFETALELDPENLIALRHLVEIARANGDSRMARRWYERILDVDPHNDEIAQQLSALVTPPRSTPAIPEPAGTSMEEPGLATAEYIAIEAEEPVPAEIESAAVDVPGNLGETADETDDQLIDLGDLDGFDIAAAPPLEDQQGSGEPEPRLSLPVEPTPLYVTPIYSTPVSSAPVDSAPVGSTPAISIPVDSTPASSTPVDSAPVGPTPADSTPAAGAESQPEGLVHGDETPPGDPFADAFPDALAGDATAGDSLPALQQLGDDHTGDTSPVLQSGELSDEPVEESGPVDIGEAVRAFERHDPAHEMSPHVGGTPTAPAHVDEPPLLSSIDELGLDFEEGLVAPEWPDTSLLVGRLDTPPDVSSLTPVYSEAAVAAFGREGTDPAPDIPVEEPEYGERVAGSTSETDSQANAEADRAGEVEPAVGVSADGLVVDGPAADAPAADAPAADAPAADAPAAAGDDEPEAGDSGLPWISSSMTPVEAQPEPVQESQAVIGESPESGPPEAPGEVDVPEAEVEELARALSRDARASGENEAIRVEEIGEAGDVIWTRSITAPTLEAVDETKGSPEWDDVAADAERYAGGVSQDKVAAEAESVSQDMVAAETEGVSPDVAEAVTESAHQDASGEPASSAQELDSPAFFTETMGELLVSQGFLDRALIVYEELVRRRPYDEVLAARLAELRGLTGVTEEKDAPQPALSSAAQEMDGPPPVASAIAEDAIPASAPSSAGPAGAVASPAAAVDLPEAPAAGSEEMADPAGVEVAGSDFQSIRSSGHVVRPTARQRFAKLAVRRVPRRTPAGASAAVEPPSEGLAALFGTSAGERHEDYAARMFADAFAPMDEPPVDSHSIRTPIVVTRTVTAPVVPAIEADEPAPRTPASSFSFDQFFPDPAAARPLSPTPSANPAQRKAAGKFTPASAPPVSDDLAEFAAWLKGLDKQ